MLWTCISTHSMNAVQCLFPWFHKMLLLIQILLDSFLRSPFWENVKEILNPETSLGAEPWVYYTIYAFFVFIFNIFDIVSNFINLYCCFILKCQPLVDWILYMMFILKSNMLFYMFFFAIMLTMFLMVYSFICCTLYPWFRVYFVVNFVVCQCDKFCRNLEI